MEFHRLNAFLDESRTLTEQEFAARHGSPAFLVEPFDAAVTDSRKTTSKLPLGKSPHSAYAIHPDARITWIPAAQGIIRLGRDPACEIVLPHKSVSKRHAVVQRTPRGWCIVDDHSSNGTLLNDVALTPGRTTPLEDGDAIALAAVVQLRPFFSPALLYTLLRGPEDEPAPAPPADATPIPTRASRTYPVVTARLASVFRALGLEVESEPGALVVAGTDGLSKARITFEPGALVVELLKVGIGVARKQFAAGQAGEEAARVHVLQLLGFF